MRYLGHRDTVSLLVNDLRLSERRELLKDILENAVPITLQDVVVTFCTVTGYRNGDLVERNDARKIYHTQIAGEDWSAIQITTASGLCAVLDMHVQSGGVRQGFIRQEDVDFDLFMQNRFGRNFDGIASTRFRSI